MESAGSPVGRGFFILKGLVTFLVGFMGFLIPSTPDEVKSLIAEEKVTIKLRLEKDRPAALTGGHFKGKEVFRALVSPHVLMLILISFFNGTTIYGLAIFMPSIVSSLGFSPIRSLLLSVGPFAGAFFVTLLASYMSDKYKTQSIPIICSGLLSAIGYIVYLTTHHKYNLYGSLFLTTSGVYSIPLVSSAWVANNSEPHYCRATAIALAAVFTNCGGILSTWSFPSAAAPKYTNTIIMNLVFVLLIAVTAEGRPPEQFPKSTPRGVRPWVSRI